MLVSARTADTRRTARRPVACGVDSITTNRADAPGPVRTAGKELGT
ncbi:hypothetical protein ACFQ60_33915 [Streptomyces zhihengii]